MIQQRIEIQMSHLQSGINEMVNLIGGGSVIDHPIIAGIAWINQTVSMCLPLRL